jgi:hypothetical protein
MTRQIQYHPLRVLITHLESYVVSLAEAVFVQLVEICPRIEDDGEAEGRAGAV